MCEEEAEIILSKTRQLLSEAQSLLRDMEEMLKQFALAGPSNQTQPRMIQPELCQASVEEDGETLIIDGFRFDSAVSEEDLRRLSCLQAGAGQPQDHK